MNGCSCVLERRRKTPQGANKSAILEQASILLHPIVHATQTGPHVIPDISARGLP